MSKPTHARDILLTHAATLVVCTILDWIAWTVLADDPLLQPAQLIAFFVLCVFFQQLCAAAADLGKDLWREPDSSPRELALKRLSDPPLDHATLSLPFYFLWAVAPAPRAVGLMLLACAFGLSTTLAAAATAALALLIASAGRDTIGPHVDKHRKAISIAREFVMSAVMLYGFYTMYTFRSIAYQYFANLRWADPMTLAIFAACLAAAVIVVHIGHEALFGEVEQPQPHPVKRRPLNARERRMAQFEAACARVRE